MNLLLLEAEECGTDGIVRLQDRRRLAALQRLDPRPGRRLRAGIVDGQLGSAEVLHADADELLLQLTLDHPPPAPSQVELILALPRPKMLRRMLRGISEAGVKRVCLINSSQVDKSYWQSPLLQTPATRQCLLEGLEQVGDTVLPQVHLAPRFRPFVEDELPTLCAGRQAWLADPRGDLAAPERGAAPQSLAIGPEGGFTPFEVDMFCRAGFQSFSMGARIFRVETALMFLLGRLA